MKSWIKVLAGALGGAAGLLIVAVFLFLYCGHRRRRQLMPTNVATSSTSAHRSMLVNIPKLHLPGTTGRLAGLGFHHLGRQEKRDQRHSVFAWEDHPNLVAEAAEHGWTKFQFDAPESGSWEVFPGGSEPMQLLHIVPRSGNGKPDVGIAGGSGILGDEHDANILTMSLPLPGPALGGLLFPQEAYFEITITELAQGWSQRDKSRISHVERSKLAGKNSGAIGAVNAIPEPNMLKDEAREHGMIMFVGLATGAPPPGKLSFLGLIAFHFDGVVYLDGMKLGVESEKSAWAHVDKVIGCGFEPRRKKVFFTVDGQLVHVINCNSDIYANPLFPTFASNADVTVVVNLGQSRFKYAPVNAARSPNPNAVRSNSSISGSAAGEYDSGELFSVGRVDSGWHEIMARAQSRAGLGKSSGGTMDSESDSELFEISLKE